MVLIENIFRRRKRKLLSRKAYAHYARHTLRRGLLAFTTYYLRRKEIREDALLWQAHTTDN